jgi:hypothetical protein
LLRFSVWHSKTARDEEPADEQYLLSAPELFDRLQQRVNKPKDDLPVFNLATGRGTRTAVSTSGVVGDFDGLPTGAMQSVHERMVERGWAHLLYTSSTNGIAPGEETEPQQREKGLKKRVQRERAGLGSWLGPERFRLVQPSARDLAYDELERYWKGLSAVLGIPLSVIDSCSWQPSRLYYWPGPQAEFLTFEGASR